MPVLSPAMSAALEEADAWQRPLYEDLHAHPELSMQEERTRGVIRGKLEEFGYAVQEIGGGVVGVLENGPGRTALFRADFDGLPVQEASGVPYASLEKGRMHACGHDVHVTAALGAAQLLAAHREDWQGTYVALFQPGEEIAAGARSMLDAGLADAIPRPDVYLGQHVLASPATGRVAIAPGPVMSTAASARVRVFGAGSHGSMPHLGVDPVVLASAIVLRLQTLVAREIAPGDFGVVTVGSVQAGSSANIIPDDATLLLNFRAYSEDFLERLIGVAERIVRAECVVLDAPRAPEITLQDRFPLTENDEAVTATVRSALIEQLGAEDVEVMEPITASEDVTVIPRALGVPSCYWGLGGFPAEGPTYPNHSPQFVPVPQPTLRTGTLAALTAVLGSLRATD